MGQGRQIYLQKIFKLHALGEGEREKGREREGRRRREGEGG